MASLTPYPPPSQPSERPPPSAGAHRASLPGHAAVQRRSFTGASVDQARELFVRLYSEASLEPLAGRSFTCSLEVALLGGVRLVAGQWQGGAAAVLHGIERRYIISFAAEGTGGATFAGVRHPILPGRRAAVFSPESRALFTVGAYYEGRSVVIDQADLEAHLAMLTGRRHRGPVLFDGGLDIASGPAAAVAHIVQLLRGEAERPEASPLLLASLRSALLTSLLTNARHSAAALFEGEPRRIAPASVRRAEEFIAAHAADAISLSDIVEAAGVPARSLRAAFAASRGVGPSELLRRCRFDLARRRLLEAAPGTTVASVVTALGLGGAGRFSVQYRRRFGESPSETLSAARRRVGSRERVTL
jgi:AraC-like DNA-binding protein